MVPQTFALYALHQTYYLYNVSKVYNRLEDTMPSTYYRFPVVSGRA